MSISQAMCKDLDRPLSLYPVFEKNAHTSWRTYQAITGLFICSDGEIVRASPRLGFLCWSLYSAVVSPIRQIGASTETFGLESYCREQKILNTSPDLSKAEGFQARLKG